MKELEQFLALADAVLEAQGKERAKAEVHCANGAEAMAARSYESAVVEYKAAQACDVNDATMEKKIRVALSEVIAAREHRDAARSSTRQQLADAQELMSAKSWERSIEECTAALDQEADCDYADTAFKWKVTLTLLVSKSAQTARDEAREQAAQLNNTADARFQANDYTAAADHYQAAADLDTQDAELTSQLSARVHLSLASHELSEGRTCMVSHRWESGIECFERGLQQHETALAAGADGVEVLRELREGVSTCESRIAARDVSEEFAQQLLEDSVRQAITSQNRSKAEQLCRDGHAFMQRRDYAAAIQAYEAAVSLDVDDEHLAQSFRDALSATFPRPQLSEIEIARLRFAQASAAAHGALDSALDLGLQVGEEEEVAAATAAQEVEVSLELEGEELPEDAASREELKQLFIAEIAEALGVPVEMLADVELIDSSEEGTRAAAREWLTQLLATSVKATAAVVSEQAEQTDARATASLLEESEAQEPVDDSDEDETLHSNPVPKAQESRRKKRATTLFQTAVGRVGAAAKQKRVKKKKRAAAAARKKKKTIEERLHLKTVRALVALEDPTAMHSMLVDARGSEWCDAGLCLWCKRPADDPLRGLCPSTGALAAAEAAEA